MASSFIDDQFQFAEMNIRFTGNMEKTMTMIRRAIRMGYDCIVVNTDIGEMDSNMELLENVEQPPPKKKKKKSGRRADLIPAPVIIDNSMLNTSTLEANGKRLRIFSRLTVTIGDSLQLHSLMHDSNAQKFDVLAIRPTDERILQSLSRKGEFADIITFISDAKSVQWLSKSKLIQQCVSDGLTFELTYADALKDSSCRRDVLTNARLLMHSTRRGRGVVLASGAQEMIDIRAPYDAANLAILFGIDAEHSRKFISSNAKRVLLRAETRKTFKGGMLAAGRDKFPEGLSKRLRAIERLMRVPELRAQLEVLPVRKDKHGDDDNDNATGEVVKQ